MKVKCIFNLLFFHPFILMKMKMYYYFPSFYFSILYSKQHAMPSASKNNKSHETLQETKQNPCRTNNSQSQSTRHTKQ